MTAWGAPAGRQELGAEMAQGAEHRVGGGLAQAAEAGGLDHPAQLLELLQLARFGQARQQPIEQLLQLHGAGAAGQAPCSSPRR